VLDARASNLDGFLLRDTCVSSTQLNRPYWTKFAFYLLENHDGEAEFLSKANSFLQENKLFDVPPSNIDGFLSRDTCFSTSQLNRHIGMKCAFLPLLKPDRQAVFLSETNSILTGKQCARCSCF
jgi:hypothetical protein